MDLMTLRRTVIMGAPHDTPSPGRDTIRDSWDTIIANAGNGTYSTKYSVGDTKELDLGTEGKILMQIVAFDADDKADGSGKAAITWVAVELLVNKSQLNSTLTNENGYPATNIMRPSLQENGTIWNLLPVNLKTGINAVSKTSYDETTSGDVTSTEKLWIPSAREMFGGASYEQSGPVYNQIYTDANSRKKMQYGQSSATTWWLRSAYSGSNTHFCRVSSKGSASSNGAEFYNGVCLGFCL